MEIDADMGNGISQIQPGVSSVSTGIRDIEQEKQKCIEFVNTVQDIKMTEETLGLARCMIKMHLADDDQHHEISPYLRKNNIEYFLTTCKRQ
ncbi:hypothetical protein CDAR_496731 [Caerostris darwini]|uniref:Uncharacterized protein n=1 Tax=Caerostris darwini TaxID=1538125 RepID=A0AAV4U521_9ARAC|nr:hypothetical protein CDAR_496731 [Caerostris darwini]